MRAYWLPLRALPTAMFQGTVLDGEVVRGATGGATEGATEGETEGETEGARPEFHVFDAVMVSGVGVRHLPFSRRVGAVHAAMGGHVAHPEDAAVLRVKRFYGPPDADALGEHLARLRVPRDGLVFTPERDGVVFGRHWGMFKLKQSHTVDFVVLDDGWGLGVFDPRTRVHANVGRSTSAQVPGTIVECERRRGGDGEWEVLGVRADKTRANDVTTYEKTLLNAVQALSEEEVVRVWAGSSESFLRARHPPR